MQGNHSAWWRIGPDIIRVSELVPTPVFDPDTGLTHFLTDLPVMLFDALSASPRTVDDLVRNIAGSLELDDSDVEQISAALQQLEEAELIESIE